MIWYKGWKELTATWQNGCFGKMDDHPVQVRSPTNSDDLLHSLLSLSFFQMGRCAMHKCKAVVKKNKKIECSFGQHSNKFLKYFWCEPLLSVYLSTWERWQGIPSWQLRILLAYFLHLQYPCDYKHWYTVHILVYSIYVYRSAAIHQSWAHATTVATIWHRVSRTKNYRLSHDR